MILQWVARSVGILFVLFISLFALDVFGAGYSWAELAVGLFMHLLPSFALLAVLVLAWVRPLWGAAAYLVLAVASLFAFNTYREPTSFLLISAPVFVLSALFFVVAYKNKNSTE